MLLPLTGDTKSVRCVCRDMLHPQVTATHNETQGETSTGRKSAHRQQGARERHRGILFGHSVERKVLQPTIRTYCWKTKKRKNVQPSNDDAALYVLRMGFELRPL